MSTWTDLTPAQEDGLACVECGCDFLRVRVTHVPVGRSQTGSQIFVCSSHRAASPHPIDYRLLDGSVVARYDGRIPGDSPAKFLAAHPAEACYFYVAEGNSSTVVMLTEDECAGNALGWDFLDRKGTLTAMV